LYDGGIIFIVILLCSVMAESCCSSDCGCDASSIPKNKMCQRTKDAHKFDIEEVKALTSNPKFICKCCGRTANEKENLCSPTEL